MVLTLEPSGMLDKRLVGWLTGRFSITCNIDGKKEEEKFNKFDLRNRKKESKKKKK